jgi:hypothetical protein
MEVAFDQDINYGVERLQLAVSTTINGLRWSAELANELQSLASQLPIDRIGEFSDSAKDHLELAYSPLGLSEFALRLASSNDVLRTSGVNLCRDLIQSLLKRQDIARGARFLVLAIDRLLQPQPLIAGHLYAGWEWE